MIRGLPSRWRIVGAAIAVVFVAIVGVVVAVTVRGRRTAQPTVPVIAQRPAMGWNSWNSDGCQVSAASVERAADALVSSGMRAAGYRYVVVDDCWVAPQRDSSGRLQADPVRFPHGIAALAAYVHSRGLLFGLYSSATDKTCAQRGTPPYPGATGSEGHEVTDAKTFAGWGIDLLKYDWCSTDRSHDRQVRDFTAMRDALRATGRPILFSINPNSKLTGQVPGETYDWASIAPMARIALDTYPAWTISPSVDNQHIGLLDTIDKAIPLRRRSGPGHWNDLDMLVVGVAGHPGTESPGLSATEDRTQFGLWAMLSAPLIAGNDVATMSPETAVFLTNREVLAVDQDAAARVPWIDPSGQVWIKPLADGSVAVALFNRQDTPQRIATNLESSESTGSRPGLPKATEYRITNLWTGATRTGAPALDRTVAAHDTELFRIRAQR